MNNYLSVKGYLPARQPFYEVAFDWNDMFAFLLEKGVKVCELADITVSEALIYTVDRNAEQKGSSIGRLKRRREVMQNLPDEDKIILSRIRSNSY